MLDANMNRLDRREKGGRSRSARTLATLWASAAGAVNINFVSGATGNDIDLMRELVKPWEAETGNTVTFVPMPSSTTDQFAPVQAVARRRQRRHRRLLRPT